MLKPSIRLYAFVAALLATGSPALAQFRPQPLGGAASPENYRIEASAGFWSPSTDMLISSESLGIIGSEIDFKRDLGLTDQRFGEIQAVLKAGRKHKFRFQRIPIKFAQETVLERRIVFNGQAYNIGVPVNSELNWKAYRFGYEYDVVSNDRGFAGFVLEAKYTDVRATLATPAFSEFAHASAPIPAIGGIGRFYVVPYISITGELSGFKLPESVAEGYKAHYLDFNLYGTVNFNRNFGAQVGFRTFDLGYLVEEDTGSFVLKGMFFGVVARY